MSSYIFMGITLFLALGAIKIDGWLAAIVLLAATVISSPAIQIPDKRIKWALAGALLALGLLLFPDVEQYRINFEQELNTNPLPASEPLPQNN